MKLSPEEVRKISELARLEMNPAEIEKYSAQLSNILSFVERLNELDVSGIEPTAHAISVPTPMQSDEPAEFKNQEEVLSQVPDREGRFFKVPKVI
ncbi:MAG: Asp-tRNA(Asn)/Glu-tRNA(Gln) amidotransferase subunit GatC [Deltaproteobacteria bacterium]|nr:Asp-tRNA(Asn)/Glu-tRNA(Gln) amidotransferase subunit GatC [Deltaproteobacteria bacterium]MBI4374356.1 Asp-tRNA(Asn)/Glu-tRNA(Gln) amidotransferase subunit GatC [Deltaproteobacteria bacterium]